MSIAWLLERMTGWLENPAMVWRDRPVTYGEILDSVRQWQDKLVDCGVNTGKVVALEGDYSPNAVAALLALIERGMIIVPVTQAAAAHREEYLEIAQVEAVISLDEDDQPSISRRDITPAHPLILQLRAMKEPGLVLFSSGSTGKSKAALHNFTKLLEKFKVPRNKMCTLTFLLLDHIGGINTLFYVLSNGGTVVSVRSRDPEIVCQAIQNHRVELLPTSPTFLNLLLISEAYRRYDLSSLKLITYGTEIMPESTLKRLNEIFPNIRLQQTYGLSELGILRSKSKDNNSLWVKIGGEGYQIKVVNGILWVKAESAMLGYLNAPSPFDEEGWMNTGDMVEVDGEYVRILGRQSEIINVGGQKVYPAEVESVLLQMDNVRDVVVVGESNPITGQMVTARVNLKDPEDPRAFKVRMHAFCRDKLASYKIPVKVEILSEEQYSARYKRMRRIQAEASDTKSLDAGQKV